MTHTGGKLRAEHNKGEVSETVTPSRPTAVCSPLHSWVTPEVEEVPKTGCGFLISGDIFLLVFCDFLVFTHSAER